LYNRVVLIYRHFKVVVCKIEISWIIDRLLITYWSFTGAGCNPQDGSLVDA
jgi:hypothetical protein